MAPGPPTPTVADAIRAGGGAVVDVTDAEALVWTDPLDVTGLVEHLVGAPGIRRPPRLGQHEGGIRATGRGARPCLGTCRPAPAARPGARMGTAVGTPVEGQQGHRRGRRRDRRSFPGPPSTLRGRGHSRTPPPPTDRGCDQDSGHRSVARGLPGADLVVLALALTSETVGIIGATELQRMEQHTPGW